MIKLSKSGLEKFTEELLYKKEVLIPKTAEEFQAAVADGDGIHDNPMIRDKRFELDKLIDEVMKLENIIQRAVVWETSESDKIEIGNTVIISDGEKDKTIILISEEESGLIENGITTKSPLGSQLLGKKKGDQIEVFLPNGNKKNFVIKSIS